MDLSSIIAQLKKDNLLEEVIKKHTLLIDDKMNEQGALFFIPFNKKEIKIVLPAPVHQIFLKQEQNVTYKNLLAQKEIIILT